MHAYYLHARPENRFHTMTPSQTASLSRILKLYASTSTECQPDVYTMSHQTEDWGSFVSVTVKVERTDCEPFSPRAVLCADGGHFLIGRRGKIKVGSTHKVVSGEYKTRHLIFLCEMLDAKMA